MIRTTNYVLKNISQAYLGGVIHNEEIHSYNTVC